ncbi:MaoC family dehydratase [Aquabacterium sp. J223]|uniref:MaoC family dehydratase n=1 Tax=Aquabacterium sp. J223 TaxID=2898431 RepID=UPI0021ADD4F7|nr:MaoC family dehydratase [Aquabacterium sp. J223]UUX96694.1 MaoC family dehydratase [Aquabacterium sp. J223]
MTVVVERADDLAAHVGTELGASDWVTIDQAKIDAFADLTGDDHWIHVDAERARRDRPDGRTIAHGFYLLALIPFLQRRIYTIRQRGVGLNYGCERVRFTSPVPVGSRVRLRQTVKACTRLEGATRLTFTSTMDVEGQSRPALVADTILQIHDR